MKKSLIILLLICLPVAARPPAAMISYNQSLTNWLCQAPLTYDNIKLAMNLTGIIHPEIVLLQIRLETGNLTSSLCREHNNIAGMKKPAVRRTTATGKTKSGYAYYDTWFDSIIDIGLFQQYYIQKGRDLSDYEKFLSGLYAEDPLYLVKLKRLCTNTSSK
jgi:hypothetical protein